jgi:hypothetical protein
MKSMKTLRRLSVALLLLVAFLIQGTWALAGTTGGLNGTATDSSGAPIAGATVTAASPSQTATTTTDDRGAFRFLSLAPDTYTVSIEKADYDSTSIAGVTIFADNTQTISLHTNKALKEIGHTVSTAPGSLVKSGTTADIYSVNAATQATLQGIGGGYNLNSAYSGIYSQPGVSSYIGNYGQGQVFYIRGASYGETGYEFDGVPVNRSFDNYNGNTLSNLGQGELEVYTGGSPSSGTSATLGGYINQVIKTGTYPGFGTATLALGAPGFYHTLNVESGGASPNRNFSWYAGFGGNNQTYKNGNNSDMGNISSDGMNSYGFFGSEAAANTAFNTGFYGNGPFAACPNQDPTAAPPTDFIPGGALSGNTPLCNTFGVQAAGFNVYNQDRETVINLHFGLPHKKDGGKDDIQILYDHGSAHSVYSDSINDAGGAAAYQRAFGFISPNLATSTCAIIHAAAPAGYSNRQCAVAGGPSPFPYQDGYIYAPGTQFGANATNAIVNPYYFPGSPTNRPLFYGIDPSNRSGIYNDVAIAKVQYQKNMGSNAYARIYGYTFYSDWLMSNPNQATLYYSLLGLGYGQAADYTSPDYELETHSRGLSFEYANQLNSQNLLRFTANYVTATLNRFNNQTWLGNGLTVQSTVFPFPILFAGTRSTSLADANGNCYNTTTGALASCLSGSTTGTYNRPTQLHTETACGYLGALTPACVANASFIVTRPSGSGTTNGIIPKFTTFALEDEFRPNDKLDINLGVRMERYEYDLVNSNTPAFNMFFNAAQHVYCYDPVTKQPILTPLGPTTPPPANPVVTAYNGVCPVGPSGQPGLHPDGVGGHLLYSATSPSSLAHNLFSPRIGGTYTFNPDTVLRFSAGRYTQPTPAAFEQYLNQNPASAASSDFSHFFGFGFYNPSHDNPVQTSNNYDVSLEKHLKNTDVTLKLSPFYRYTTNQSVTVPLGPNFVSAVNLGTQRSTGVEFQIQKGDPTRDGWSGAISYTYTSAKMRFENAPSGRNAIDTLNDYIKAFNALTQGGGGAQCYSTTLAQGPLGNVPEACIATSIKNPYYAMSVQPLLDRTAFYNTYPNQPPGDPGSNSQTAISPNLITGWMQWKKNKLAIAPNFVLAEGASYGGPTDIFGTDPRTCGANQSQGLTPIVPPGSTYALNADYFQCGASISGANGYLAVPNSFNGNNFSSLGQYREPWQINIGAQVRYDVSPKMTAVLDLANLYNRCFGGSSTAWSSAFAPGSYVCGYGNQPYFSAGSIPGGGFFYGASPTDPVNGTTPLPKALLYPYGTLNGALPFQAYFQLSIKL